MSLAAKIIIAAVALLHVYIFLLETVLFRTRGRKVFGFSEEQARTMAPLMSNQGCYNAFLALALGLALVLREPALQRAFAAYGLTCVAIAGIWGAATAKRSILFIQTLPAVLGLGALYLG